MSFLRFSESTSILIKKSFKVAILKKKRKKVLKWSIKCRVDSFLFCIWILKRHAYNEEKKLLGVINDNEQVQENAPAFK